MHSDDIQAVKVLTDLCESFLACQVAQVKAAEATVLRFQRLEKNMKQCVKILALPDVPERKPLIEQFLLLTESATAAHDDSGLFDALARLQSDQERLESYVAQLRDFLDSQENG